MRLFCDVGMMEKFFFLDHGPRSESMVSGREAIIYIFIATNAVRLMQVTNESNDGFAASNE